MREFLEVENNKKMLEIKRLKEDAIKKDRNLKEANTQLTEHTHKMQTKDVLLELHRG